MAMTAAVWAAIQTYAAITGSYGTTVNSQNRYLRPVKTNIKSYNKRLPGLLHSHIKQRPIFELFLVQDM